MADSKRKRSEDERVSPPKKTRALAPAASLPYAIRVTSVLKPEAAPPVVATTPGINLPDSIDFHLYAKPDKSKKKGGSQASAGELMLYSDEHERMDFTAREDRPEIMNKLLKHYIGAFDPKTGELQIVEARKMIVRGAVRARKAADQAMVEPSYKNLYSQQRTELGETFGTERARKALKSKVENAITADTSGKLAEGDVALLEMIRENAATMPTADEVQAFSDRSRLVPQSNLEADVIQDVYKPEDIIGAEILKAIPVMDWQDKAKEGEAIEVPSRFVARRVNVIATDEDAMMKLRILRYLLWVLVFWKSTQKGKGRDIRRVAKADVLRRDMAGAPKVVIESIRRKFSSGTEMLKTHIDLLKTHCCVFSCLIDNFETDTLDLREDLEMDQADLNRYFKEIGARVKIKKKDGKTQHIATLALPLQFPKKLWGRPLKR